MCRPLEYLPIMLEWTFVLIKFMCCVCGDVMKRGKMVKRVGIKLPVGRRLQALEKVITDTST